MARSTYRLVSAVLMLACAQVRVQAQSYATRGGARTTVNQGANVNRGANVSRNANVNQNANVNRNVNVNQNVDVNRNVNVSTNYHGGYSGGYGGCCYHPSRSAGPCGSACSRSRRYFRARRIPHSAANWQLHSIWPSRVVSAPLSLLRQKVS